MSGYRGEGTPGGRVGCGLAALVGAPLALGVFVLGALGDCAPDVDCHRGLDWRLMAAAIAIAAVIGLTARVIVNWAAAGRRQDR